MDTSDEVAAIWEHYDAQLTARIPDRGLLWGMAAQVFRQNGSTSAFVRLVSAEAQATSGPCPGTHQSTRTPAWSAHLTTVGTVVFLTERRYPVKDTAPVLEHTPAPPIYFADCIGHVYCMRCGVLLRSHLAGESGVSPVCKITGSDGQWVFGFNVQEMKRMFTVAVEKVSPVKHPSEHRRYRQIVAQLESAPDSDGYEIWIDGFGPIELLRLAHIAVMEVPLDKYPQDWTRMGRLARQLNGQLMAGAAATPVLERT